jgi:flagellar biosynthesis protein FliQ
MGPDAIVRILREALLLVLLLSAAPVLASMVVGFLISIFQATTQIQEQTLSYVPKLIAVFATLAIIGPWMLLQTVRFTTVLFDSIVLVR